MKIVDSGKNLIIVELGKVVDNDGNRKSHHEDATDRAAGPDELAKAWEDVMWEMMMIVMVMVMMVMVMMVNLACCGIHVAVANSGHGDDRPPIFHIRFHRRNITMFYNDQTTRIWMI